VTHLVFRDSLEAALGLADALEAYKQTRASVLAVSCASLPMGRLIADALGAQLRVAGLPAEWASASWHEVIPSRRERAESSMPFGSPEEAACEADLEDPRQGSSASQALRNLLIGWTGAANGHRAR